MALTFFQKIIKNIKNRQAIKYYRSIPILNLLLMRTKTLI